METIIFTDGSSRGNPGPGGWGAIVCFGEGKERKVKELGGRNQNTTNNRMELKAVIEGLDYIRKKSPETHVTLFTDSEYVKKGATEWIYGWQANDWKTKTKADVLNKDLWEDLLPLLSDLDIEIKVVRGHAGIPANERCDVIATSFADDASIDLFSGDFSDYKVSLDIGVKDIRTASGAGSSKSKSAKAYSYISNVKGVVKIHGTWSECEARVKGQSGARFKKSISKIDEAKIVRELS